MVTLLSHAQRVRALLDACRVPDSVDTGHAGLWTIARVHFTGTDMPAAIARHCVGYSSMTMLFRATLASLHKERGECVMEDSASELRRHLPILLAATGRVLVSGLGLGCVVRGLLSKPDVEHIDVLEVDPAIVQLVGREFAHDPRVTLHVVDAERFVCTGQRWDYAWHDVWSEHEALDVVHARLMVKYAPYMRAPGRQGAWQLDRRAKRIWPQPLIGARRRQRRVPS